jgi:hypothetical protein
MLEDLPREPFSLILRCWQLAGALTLASLIPLWVLMDEPFWCLAVPSVLALLVLPGALAAGWLFVLALVASRWRERGMRLSSLALPLLAAPSLLVCYGAVDGYLGDLQRSPALLCADMPDYGRCFAER